MKLYCDVKDALDGAKLDLFVKYEVVRTRRLQSME